MLERNENLEGCTYVIRPPRLDRNVYITINHTTVDGQLRPFELFVNSKDVESYPWINLIMRLVSAQLRQPGSFPWFVLDELRETIDPAGGYIIPKSGGVFVASVAAHVGYVLEQHCERLGLTREGT